MTDFASAFALAFGLVLLVELPDKTLVATLVLSTRYRARPVLMGVAVAFAVQCVIAVTFGRLLTLLPHRVVEAVVALLFAIGSVLLLRESFATDDEQDAPDAPTGTALSFVRIAVTSFGVLFAAEWGDASQIATAGLVASRGEPLAVGLGAWLALVGVAAAAVVGGRLVLRWIPLRIVHRVAGLLFAIFAVLAAVAAVRG